MKSIKSLNICIQALNDLKQYYEKYEYIKFMEDISLESNAESCPDCPISACSNDLSKIIDIENLIVSF